MPNYENNHFKCPYCFGEMTHSEVIFRANTGFSQEDLEQDDSGFTMISSNQDRKRSSDLELKRLFRRYDDESSYSDSPKLDEPLIRFWKDRGGSSGYVNADPNWDYPHIDPRSPDEFRKMVLMEPRGALKPDPDGFIRDKDGFITRVIDRYSDSAAQMTRLCPHCHNPLPLPDYGKYPIIFISVVGITGAGKTVYLNQLLTRFATVIQNTGYRMGPAALAVNELVMENHPLPSSTDDRIMRRPLAVSLTRENNPQDGMTIVFYDIAGENCVDSIDSKGNVKDSTTIGHFIAYCDALMFLIDPDQVPIFAPVAVSKAKNVQSVIDVVNRIRSALNPDHPSWDDIPVAAVLTKSDLLRGKLSADSPIFQHLSSSEQKGFNRSDFYTIHQQLFDRFAENAVDIAASMSAFAQKAYFAVSAITCGVENRFEKYQNIYSFTAENDKKFKSLIDWSREWNKRSPEEREHFSPCPVLDVNGQPILFAYDTPITQETTANITTEIFAESIQNGHVDRIHLDFWEIASESINPIGYPTAPPNPRRIAEPIRWILWKKRFMAPYFNPSLPPKKGFFESAKRYEQRMAEWRTQNTIDEQRFYFEHKEENG